MAGVQDSTIRQSYKYILSFPSLLPRSSPAWVVVNRGINVRVSRRLLYGEKEKLVDQKWFDVGRPIATRADWANLPGN